MTSIWDSNTSTLTGVITTYGTDFSSALTSVNAALSSIQAYVASMVAESEKEASTTVSSTTTTTAATKTSSSSSTSTSKSTSSSSSSTNFTDAVKKGVAAAIWIYGTKSGWGTGSTRKSRLTSKFGSSNATAVQSYINAHGSNGDLYKYWVNSGKSNLSKYYYSAFKTGGLADYTGMAWMDGTKTDPELVLNAQDTKNFLLLKDALSSMVQGGVSTDSYATALDDIVPAITNLVDTAYSSSGNENPLNETSNVWNISLENLSLPNVQNYAEFMTQMQHDSKFENMILDMTLNRACGKSSLAKYKYRWENK